DTFVGTKECFDTMPVFPNGSTRTYHPVQYFPDDRQKASQRRFDGLVGGWMPAVRKIMSASEIAYDEVIVFGDVEAQDKFIVRSDTFVGTKECFDTMPVFPNGSTRTYHPVQYFPDDRQKASQRRFDGLVGGWMPAVRKILSASEIAYDEVIVFGDVEAQDKFIVQTWHRTARIEHGKISKAIYGHSYPAFPPARTDPQPEKFYRALLRFVVYWESLLSDFASASVPQNVWLDMSKHAFAKEVMVRPGGVYPKYGAVDRDYYGSEYDGFQDIFSSSVYTNLEWGRFKTARAIIDNYFSDFVDGTGMINMRGPETAQFGMT